MMMLVETKQKLQVDLKYFITRNYVSKNIVNIV